MEFLASQPMFAKDVYVQELLKKISAELGEKDGLCYYKYPIIKSSSNQAPDLCVLVESKQPFVVKSFNFKIDDIEKVDREHWTIQGGKVDPPMMELEDFVFGLEVGMTLGVT